MASASQQESLTKHSDREVEILEQLKLVEGSNLWSITYKRMRKDTMGMIGLSIVVFLILVGIFAFVVQQYDALFGLNNPSGDPWDLHKYFLAVKSR
jgi:hypothetical protein